jgi:heparosan-N-sulfate-glucuronate 5-epimerase
MRKLARLLRNYVTRREGGASSSAGFWYLPEPPRVHDAESLRAYEASAMPSPLYLMDYSAKRRYRVTDAEGLIALNYGPPIGLQRNPEAAFQYALACHDAGDHATFFRYAEAFRKTTDARGRWSYTFDWYRSTAPWHSALAQSRGASVMLRAWLLSGDTRYREAAHAALALFDTVIAEGGFQAVHPKAGVTYLEEYPSQQTGVLNGFLASLFGMWEVGRWLDDPASLGRFDRYLASAERMLPYYTTSWWTLYDLDPDWRLANVHSPRYHRLATDYLRVLAAVAPSPVIAEYRDRWIRFEGPLARTGATALKAFKKIIHR